MSLCEWHPNHNYRRSQGGGPQLRQELVTGEGAVHERHERF